MRRARRIAGRGKANLFWTHRVLIDIPSVIIIPCDLKYTLNHAPQPGSANSQHLLFLSPQAAFAMFLFGMREGLSSALDRKNSLALVLGRLSCLFPVR